MQHYATLFHVSGIAKSEKYAILQIDKQSLAVMQQFKNIKHEVCYIIFVE